MNKTVYLRDEEVPTWERARELSGDKLSPVIVAALKSYIVERESRTRGFVRIELEFNDAQDHGLPKKKAFFGRWIIDRAKPLRLADEAGEEADVYSVAETAKGSVVVFKYSEGPDFRSWQHFLVYGSFELAAADDNVNAAIREAVRRRGVAVEELDI